MSKKNTNQLRIIGGQWRSRKLSFPDVVGLRPTPDRVRETLFNWLTGQMHGTHVLDAFAGSGALFFEALSRGAASGLALEQDHQASQALQDNLLTLKAENAHIIRTDALQYLATPANQRFDIVLLDPPFQQNLLLPSCQLLEQQGWLADQSWIYTESEQAPDSLALPAHWRLHRQKHAGQVYYALWQRTTAPSAQP